MTKIEAINFGWLYSKLEHHQDINNLDLTKMQKVDIPHNNIDLPYSNFSENLYQFESVYQKTIQINKREGYRNFVKFDGVLHYAVVYVNNILVGEHKGGYTAFEFDITEASKDGLNNLVVYVDSRETLNIAPFGKKIDYLTYGGVYREVYLIERPNNYIRDVIITTSNILTNPTIKFDVDVTGGNAITIKLLYNSSVAYEIKGTVNETLEVSGPLHLWDIKNPNLYTVEVTLDDLDVYSFKTGFREAEFRKDGFFLNGKRLKIQGLNRHQIYPYVGYAMPKTAQVEDAKLAKKTGNAVRTSHYPQSKHFMNACDELGVMVFTEAPGWQNIGDETWKLNYLQQVEEMIQENKHHPSVILWGVRVNESGDDTSLYSRSNSLSRKLDSRPTGGVRCFNYSETLEDVYTYNDFIHNGTNVFLKPIDQVLKTDHPYLITEFMGHMYPTKANDTPERLINHAVRYASILNQYQGIDRISGGFGWALVDYYTHKEFGSGDHICYHGIYDNFRLPKPAAKVYESQEATKPYLEFLNSMDIGDFDAGFVDAMHIASNAEKIELYQDQRFVGTFYPRFDLFPNLKHPLYIIDDFYGDAIEKDGYTKEEATELKKLANSVAKRGGLDKILDEENMDWNKMQVAWKYYGSLVANWGSDTFTYTVKGYYKDEVITKVIGPYETYDIKVKADKTTLTIDETYDVTRIVIEAIDNLGNIKPYAHDSFMIKAEGSVEVIGDSLISLVAGRRGVWIKTKHEGSGKITIQGNKSSATLVFHVEHK